MFNFINSNHNLFVLFFLNKNYLLFISDSNFCLLSENDNNKNYKLFAFFTELKAQPLEIPLFRTEEGRYLASCMYPSIKTQVTY
jgi:hypothetical protein